MERHSRSDLEGVPVQPSRVGASRLQVRPVRSFLTRMACQAGHTFATARSLAGQI